MTPTPDDFDPGPPHPVSRTRIDDRWALTVIQLFPHSAAAVWSALTDPTELGAWAPYTADRNLATVGPATLLMSGEAEETEFVGEVTLAVPPRPLDHAWGRHRLQWRLRPVDTGTEVTLVHILGVGVEPGELPSMAAGWHLCLVVAQHLLDGSPIDRIFGASALDHGFVPLQNAYVEALESPGW